MAKSCLVHDDDILKSFRGDDTYPLPEGDLRELKSLSKALSTSCGSARSIYPVWGIALWICRMKGMFTFTFSVNGRTNRMSFQSSLRSNTNEIILGRANGIPDGAFVIKTDKAKDLSTFCTWSKRRCALCFEVYRWNLVI